MSTRSALAAGTAASLAVTAVWSFTATLTISSPPVLYLTRDLPGDYMQLAGAATGSSPAVLFAVVAVVYAACFLSSGLRARRKVRREAAHNLDLELAEDTGAATASGGYR